MINNFLTRVEEKALLKEWISSLEQQFDDEVLQVQTLLYLNKGISMEFLIANMFPSFSIKEVESIIDIWLQPYLARRSDLPLLPSETKPLMEEFFQILDSYTTKKIDLKKLITLLSNFFVANLEVKVAPALIRELVASLGLYNPMVNKQDPFILQDIRKIIFDYSSVYDVKNLMLVSSTWRDEILFLLRNQTEIIMESLVKHKITSGGKDLTLKNLLIPKMVDEVHSAKHYDWEFLNPSEYTLPENLQHYLQSQIELQTYQNIGIVGFPPEIIDVYIHTAQHEDDSVVVRRPIASPLGSYSIDCFEKSFSLEELLVPQELNNFFDFTKTRLETLGEYFILVVRKQVGQNKTTLKAFAPIAIILMAKKSSKIENDFLIKKLQSLGTLSIPLVEVICAKSHLRKLFDGTLDLDCINAVKEGQPLCVSLEDFTFGERTYLFHHAIMRKLQSKINKIVYGIVTNIPNERVLLEISRITTLAALSNGSQKLIISTLMHCLYSKVFISPLAIYVNPPQMHVIFDPCCSAAVLSEFFVSGFQATMLEKLVLLEKIFRNIVFTKRILEYELGYMYLDNIFLYYSRYLDPETNKKTGHKMDVLLDPVGIGGNELHTGVTAISKGELYFSPKRVRGEPTSVMREILYVLGVIFHLFNLQGEYSDYPWSFNKSHPGYEPRFDIEGNGICPQQDPSISLGSQLIRLLSAEYGFSFCVSRILKNSGVFSYNNDPASISSWGLRHPAINNILGLLGNYCIIQSQQNSSPPMTILVEIHNLLQMAIRIIKFKINPKTSNEKVALAEEIGLKKLYDDYMEHERIGRRKKTPKEWSLYFETHKRAPLPYNFDDPTSEALRTAAKKYLPKYMAAVENSSRESSCSSSITADCKARRNQPSV